MKNGPILNLNPIYVRGFGFSGPELFLLFLNFRKSQQQHFDFVEKCVQLCGAQIEVTSRFTEHLNKYTRFLFYKQLRILVSTGVAYFFHKIHA